jgi:hypothetical protein
MRKKMWTCNEFPLKLQRYANSRDSTHIFLNSFKSTEIRLFTSSDILFCLFVFCLCGLFNVATVINNHCNWKILNPLINKPQISRVFVKEIVISCWISFYRTWILYVSILRSNERALHYRHRKKVTAPTCNSIISNLVFTYICWPLWEQSRSMLLNYKVAHCEV